VASAPARNIAAAGLAGAAMPLAFAPLYWWWVAPVGYAILFLLWRRAVPKRAFLTGLAFGGMQFLFGIYWIVISVHQIGQAPMWLALLLMLGLVFVMALYPALVGWIASRFFEQTARWFWLGTLPALFVLEEWLRGWLFTGFGWLNPGYSQTDTWLVGFAPVLGVHGVAWAVFLVAGCLAKIAHGLRRERQLAAAVIAMLFVLGFVGERIDWTEPRERTITVALAQGATPQELKWLPESLPGIADLYRRLTVQALGADLIVWPEAAVPQLYENMPGYIAEIEALAGTTGSEVMLGMLHSDESTGAWQNAVFTLGQPESVYVKRHLVPYGEYFPVPGFVRDWLRTLELPNIDTEKGEEGQPPVALLGEQIAVTICYEDVFGAEQLGSFPEATLLVNVSNDAWFGKSIAADQHLQIARMRAAEVRRWQIRSTNSGITAVIDPHGDVTAEAPQFEPAVLRASVTGMEGATPYIWWGNWAVVILAVASVGGGLVCRKVARKELP
jgi:apolipoprotein N-acyltransferase